MTEDGKKSSARKAAEATASEGSTKLGKDSPVSTTTSTNMDNPESASATPKTPSNPDGPTAEDDRRQLDEQARRGHPGGINDLGRAVDVEVNPDEVQKNGADWLEGREETDVVEVEGQRETAGARMARNGVNSPEAQAGATTEATP